MENEQTTKPDGAGERDDDKSPRIWAATSTDGIASSSGGADAKAAEQSTPTSLLEQLLSPLVLQRMMACGGSVLVIGFVGWLWSIGIFENPVIAAVTIGAVNAAVLCVGIGLVRATRYQLAGTGMTLLAALAMPLNLWFYSAQGLITIEGGGHLWIPAAICCAVYALIARLLRNATFVYTLVGGIVLTGMLFLADQSVGHFWELLPPATFLITVGWICVLAEFLFGTEGDFSRDRFGTAFRQSGRVALIGGFGLILGGQLAYIFADVLPFDAPRLATDSFQKTWALALIGISTCCLSVECFVRRTRLSLIGVSALAGWTVLTLMDVMAMTPRLSHFAIVASAVISITLIRETNRSVVKSLGWVCGGLSLVALLQFSGQFFAGSGNLVIAPIGVLSIVHLTSTAIVLGALWNASRRGDDGSSPRLHESLVMAGVSLVWASLTVAMHLNLETLDWVAAAGLFVPVTGVVLAMTVFRNEHVIRDGIQSMAIGSLTMVLLCVGLFAGTGLVTPLATHLSLGIVLAVSTVLYFLATRTNPKSPGRLLGYAASVGTTSQLLMVCGLSGDHALVLSGSIAGGLLGIGHYLFQPNAANPESAGASVHETTTNVMVVGGSVLGIMLSLSRLIEDAVQSELLIVLASQLAVVGVTAWLTSNVMWRRTFRALAIALSGTGILVFNGLLDLHGWQRAELASIAMGVTLLVMGHIGWYREGDRKDDVASLGLWFGSLLIAIPLVVGLIYYRAFGDSSNEHWAAFHEFSGIAAALAMLGLGLLCRIRSTTIAGSTLLTVYVVSLLSLVKWPSQLQNASVAMMVGGGIFFGVAVLLSIYRDRLIALPQNIKEGRGVFRVLQWR